MFFTISYVFRNPADFCSFFLGVECHYLYLMSKSVHAWKNKQKNKQSSDFKSWCKRRLCKNGCLNVWQARGWRCGTSSLQGCSVRSGAVEVNVVPASIAALPHPGLLRLAGARATAGVHKLRQADIRHAGCVFAHHVNVRVEDGRVDGLHVLWQHCGQRRRIVMLRRNYRSFRWWLWELRLFRLSWMLLGLFVFEYVC